MEEDQRPGMVYLVGAGPGDAGLLTLRGKECLERAEVVIYDQLVSPRILQFCPPGTEFVCVRELPGCHPDRWPHIHQRMIDEARRGKCVVRLKGGDPLIFGRGGEEGETLRAVDIPYEVVPGVTTALAAGSYLEVPLTHRAHSSAIALVTGHEHPGKPSTSLNWAVLAKFPGTLAIYMGIARLNAIVAELVRHGKPPETPALVVSRVSTGAQRSVQTTLEKLESGIRHAGLTTPALVLVGTAVGLKPEKSWFELKPLLNQHVLVTRPRDQAAEFIRQLETQGAVPFHLPCLEIRPPESFERLDEAIARIRDGEFDWLAFTSANGVDGLLQRAEALGLDPRFLGRTQLAAIGSGTAEALRRYRLRADLAPTGAMNSEALGGLLRTRAAGQRVLIAAAEQGREALDESLRGAVARLERVTAYRQVEGADRGSEVFDHLRRGEIDWVTLTSTNVAAAFLQACDGTIRERLRNQQIKLVSNNPRLTRWLGEQGYPVAVESAAPTGAAMVEGIIAAVAALREREAEGLTREGEGAVT